MPPLFLCDPKMKTSIWKRSERPLYTKGELNKIVDGLLHPPFTKNPEYIILLDTFVHVLIEQDSSETIQKFIRYNLPKIIHSLMKEK